MKKSFWLCASLALFLVSKSECRGQEKAEAATSAQKSERDLPAAEGQPGTGPLRQADWYRDLWNSKRRAWFESTQSDQGVLVFLGDSITQGWPNLEEYFPGVKIANRGISGDTTRGMLIRLDGDVLAINPKGIVLLMGTNDLEENAEPETIVSNVSLIIKKLKSHDGKMPIVLCLIFPSAESKARPTDKIQTTNKLLKQLVKGDSQITVLETFKLFADPKGDAKIEEFPDLLHLNKLGYDKWAASLRPVLATLGFIENEDDHFVLEPGFVSLFNGKDLTGWEFHEKGTDRPTEKFDGKNRTSDGRYVAMHGRLVVTTPVEGSRIQQLWTSKVFPSDFVLKLEFRATPDADSGVFIRKPQLQCRDYPIAGPYKELKNYRSQDWNELVVTVKGENAHCICNGEVLESMLRVPATGPIGLEGDRGQMEYRRIRLLDQTQ